MYTRHFKDEDSTPLLVDLESTAVDSDPPYSSSLPTDPSLPIVGIDICASSDLNLPIAHRKSKRSCTQHLILNYVFYDRLTPLSR